jgi:glycosyltransferase involved in cell wall biosynthesis
VEEAMSARGRLGFFAPYLWPSFSGGSIEFAGGAEVQQAALVRGLTARGFEVAVATCDYGQGARVEREGIVFHATHPPFSGLPVLRFFHPRLTGNLRALLATRAEVFYARASGFPAGLAFDVARATRAGFVFGAAHDHDALRSMPLVELARDRWWYARAVRGADAVIAQTVWQQEAFRREWGRESLVIPNLTEIPPGTADPSGSGPVLWLSTYKDAKRPDWVVELARRFPRQRFVMAGVVPPPPLTSAAFDATRAAAASLPNLEVRGHLDRAELGAFLSEGSLFLHTSPVEGFPNTLLEAWACGLPTLSVVDPDGRVAVEQLGEVAPDLESMASALERWMGDPARRASTGRRAREYVERHHAPGAVVERVAQVMDGVVARVRARR